MSINRVLVVLRSTLIQRTVVMCTCLEQETNNDNVKNYLERLTILTTFFTLWLENMPAKKKRESFKVVRLLESLGHHVL